MTENTFPLKIIARIHTDFPTKFGIPRQSGLVKDLKARIVFEPEFRNPDTVRGLKDFSHIWLIWQFSESIREGWSATVRPPRLGGNQRLGVFATRSPFRPNPLGLSSVRLEKIEYTSNQGPVLHVSGADLMDGTPILDIKPFLPFTDNHPEAVGGFSGKTIEHTLQVVFPRTLLEQIPKDRQQALCEVLAQDPRPAYQEDPERIYGFPFAGFEVRFRTAGKQLTVVEVRKA